ncbi:hypothetical protein Droror1_Dr00005864 [Drosera rotundifolia]
MPPPLHLAVPISPSPADLSMAEVAGQNPPSLSEQYLLPKEEKVSKHVEEVRVESPVSVETPGEEVVLEEVEASVKEVAPEESEGREGDQSRGAWRREEALIPPRIWKERLIHHNPSFNN